VSWIDDDNLRIAHRLGEVEDKLFQIQKFIKMKGNERIVYTEDICRILDIDPPSPPKDTETGDQ
jgi:hypothetical protein